MCVCVCGKAKSLSKTEWLWRLIAANSRPVVERQTLGVAARVFTCFLCFLIGEIPSAFMVLKVTDVAPLPHKFSARWHGCKWQCCQATHGGGGMHKGLHRAYATSPHDINSTIEAVYNISCKLPGNRAQVTTHISQWLKRNAFREKGEYSSWRLAAPVGQEGVTGVWENHMGCLDTLAGQN